MKLKLLAMAVFVALAPAGIVQAMSVSIVDGDHSVATSPLGGLDGRGYATTTYADSSSGWGNAVAAGETIIIEQSGGNSLPVADVLAFMAGGGRVIALGGYDTDSLVINPLFGATTNILSGLGPWNKTSNAAGTTFADDAATLYNASSTHPVVGAAGLPTGSTVFYGDATAGAQVFRTTYGSGDFFYIGWDFCCGASTAVYNDYFDVLESAINFEGTPAVPLPASLPLLAAGVAGFGLVRRRNRT